MSDWMITSYMFVLYFALIFVLASLVTQWMIYEEGKFNDALDRYFEGE